MSLFSRSGTGLGWGSSQVITLFTTCSRSIAEYFGHSLSTLAGIMQLYREYLLILCQKVSKISLYYMILIIWILWFPWSWKWITVCVREVTKENLAHHYNRRSLHLIHLFHSVLPQPPWNCLQNHPPWNPCKLDILVCPQMRDGSDYGRVSVCTAGNQGIALQTVSSICFY